MLHPDLGCALAALGTEMARMAPDTKAAVSKALDAYADRLSYLMPGKTRAQRQAAFLVLFPSMAGCIMTARAHADRECQLQILACFFSEWQRMRLCC
jgi:TetR/AcrR family transcriptional repressor of nem operon